VAPFEFQGLQAVTQADLPELPKSVLLVALALVQRYEVEAGNIPRGVRVKVGDVLQIALFVKQLAGVEVADVCNRS
jgi:hypothetical protein